MATPEEKNMIKAEMEMMRSNLNFATSGNADEYDPPMKKARQARDPMSHRIIEKRRRDRMNNCLADLSQLIPQHYLKQGQGRIEKTEIIEMAIAHIRNIKQLYLNSLQVIENTNRDLAERFWLGYKEAIDEVMRFLVENQNYSPTHKLCTELQNHLQNQSQQYKPADNLDKKSTQQSLMMNDSASSSGIGSTVSDTSSTDSGKQEKPNTPQAQAFQASAGNVQKGFTVSKRENLILGGSLPTSFSDFDTLSSNSGSVTSVLGQQSHSNSQSYCPTKGYGEQNDSESFKQGTGFNFKKYIKLRFTKATSSKSDPDVQPSDSVSVSSHEEADYQELKKKKVNAPSPTSESTSSPYPASDYSSNSGNGSNENGSNAESSSGSPTAQITAKRHKAPSNSSSLPSEEEGNHWQDEASNVPGFALHPSGTNYIPIVINTEQLLPYLKQYDNLSNGINICHPVSIPVNFGGGHFLSYQVIGQTENSDLQNKPALLRSPSLSQKSHSRASSHSS